MVEYNQKLIIINSYIVIRIWILSLKEIDPLDQVFKALADKTRREIVHRLARSEQTINEISDGFSKTLAAVSKHIKILEAAKIVKRRIEGRIHYISLVPERLTGALDWISIYTNFWQVRLDQLETIIVQNDNQEN